MVDDQVVFSQNQGCPKCGSQHMSNLPDGHLFCKSCGLVKTLSTLDHSDTDQGKYKKVENRRNIKGLLSHNKTLQETSIAINMDNCLTDIFKKLHISDAVEKNITLTLYEITRIATNLHFTNEVLVEAIKIYEALAKRCGFKGKHLRALGAAIVYVSSKNVGVPCGLREVAHVANVPSSKVFRCYRFILKQLNYNACEVSFEQYLHRIQGLLRMQDISTKIANEILKVATQDRFYRGRSLTGLASAALYIASILAEENRTQREIAEVTRITEVTLRARYKDLIKRLLIVVSV